MRKEIKANMEAQIASFKERTEANLSQESKYAQAEIEQIMADAQAESDRLDTEKAAQSTFDIYQSYIKAGFSEEQAWTLVQIVMSNATKRTLF